MKRKLEVYIIFGTRKPLVEDLFNCETKIFQSNERKKFDQVLSFFITVFIFANHALTCNSRMELLNGSIETS